MTKKKLGQSITIALDGIAHGISTERNIKIQALVGVLVIIASLLLRISRSDFIIILVVSFLVIICELMNTSLERLMDFLHSEHHEAIKRVKDMLAGVVLLSILLAIVVGIIILLKPVLEFLSG
jgi:undecaprenol kinase